MTTRSGGHWQPPGQEAIGDHPWLFQASERRPQKGWFYQLIVGLGLDACVCVVRRSLWSAVGRRRRGAQRWDSDLGAGRPEEGAGVGADWMSPARRERKPSQQGLQTLEELAVYRKEPGFSRLHDAAESLSSFRESCSPGFYSSGLGEGSFHASGAVVTVRLSSMAAARTQNRDL